MHKRDELSLERQDKAELQRARQAIERRWQQSQPAVVRFQEMCRQSNLATRLPRDYGSARVHLNPLRAWCRLRTSAYLIDNVAPPATILLFAVGEVFATRVFDLEGQTLINELEDYQPCTLDQWSSLSALANRDQLVAFCRDLSASGLICCS